MVSFHQQSVAGCVLGLYMARQRAYIGKYAELVAVAVKQVLNRFPGIVGHRHRCHQQVTHLKLPMAVNNVKIATVWLYLAAFKASRQ